MEFQQPNNKSRLFRIISRVTDDILAMARPNTGEIIKRNLIAQFHAWSIKTIINLQTPGEHASCGGPLESSGFTYDPNIFMENNSEFLELINMLNLKQILYLRTT